MRNHVHYDLFGIFINTRKAVTHLDPQRESFAQCRLNLLKLLSHTLIMSWYYL